MALPVAAVGVGEWSSYLSYHNVVDNLPVGKSVYALCDGNLFVYDRETTEVQLLSKLTGMSDKTVWRMGYSEQQRSVCFVYDNGNIDLLRSDGEMVNVSQLKSANDGSLVLNSLCVSDNLALLAVGDGVVIVDVAKGEVKNYCRLGMNVKCAAAVGDTLFVATNGEIRFASLLGNVSDPAQWQTLCKASVVSFHSFGDGFYARTGNADEGLARGLWYVAAPDADGQRAMTHVVAGEQTTAFCAGSEMIFSNGSTVRLYEKARPTQMKEHFTIEEKPTQLTRDASGTYWAARGTDGLVAYRASEGTLQPVGERLGGYGPRRDLFYYMKYEGERLLVAGGRLDPFDRVHYSGTALVFENGEWTSFQEDGIRDITKLLYRDATSIAQDPFDASHHYVSTGGTGIYEFRDGKFVKQISLHNSPLRTAAHDGSPYYVRMDGLTYDDEGNLWMVNNSLGDSVLRVMKADGTWDKFYFDGLKNAPTCEKILRDSKGRLWICSRRTVSNHTAGLLCFDNNGTVSNKNDDVSMYRTSVTNQDGTSYSLDGVYSLAEDMDGRIWVGTAVGLFVIDNPEEWMEKDFLITQVKVPRNDGTNYADYLLNGMAITAIAVDGANRKWIGTENNGLYLVSPDGVETIHHFRADNSPLISDFIYSIAPNLRTGEIMIGTNLGLVSYQSEAMASAENLSEGNLKVYPNPVRPEYSGSVTLTGLTADADIKVVSTGGQVVASGTSVGGGYVWDVCNFNGRRVAPGIYYFMISTADGKTGVAAAVTVI